MVSDLKRTRADTQSCTAQGHRSSAMFNTSCCGYPSNHISDLSDYQGLSRSFHSRHTAQEIPSRSLQQRTPFSGPRAPSPRLYVAPGELSSNIDPSYESILTSQGYTASSSTENGRQTGTENYLMQPGQYPFMAEHQGWQQNLGYSGQQTFSEGSYQHSSQLIQSGSYPTSSENSRQPQQYNQSYVPPSYVPPSYVPSSYVPPSYVPPSYVPPSYLYKNRTPSIASPGSSSNPPSMMAATRPRIVVDKAQDDPISSPGNDQSSIYQDCLGTNIVSASHREASVGLNTQRSSSRTPRRSHRTRNNTMDASDLEEAAEGKLSVPRTPRRRQSEDDSQRRRRHLTPEGREHAREVRKLHACKECRRRKIKVCLVWASGFALLLTLPESQCKHVLESDLVSKPSSPGLQRDAYTFTCSSSSASSSGYPSPGIVESPLFQAAMNDFPYCQSPTPLSRAYTEPTYRDTIVDINRHKANPYRGTDPYVFR